MADAGLKRRRRPPDPRLASGYTALLRKDRRLKSCLLQPAPFSFHGGPADARPPKAPARRQLRVAGLPSTVTEEQLRTLFRWQGPLQDCTILPSSDGPIAQVTVGDDQAVRRLSRQHWTLEGHPLTVSVDDGTEPARQPRGRDFQPPPPQPTTPQAGARQPVRLFKEPEAPRPSLPHPPVPTPAPQPAAPGPGAWPPPARAPYRPPHLRPEKGGPSAPPGPPPPPVPPALLTASGDKCGATGTVASSSNQLPTKPTLSTEASEPALPGWEVEWLMECVRDDRATGKLRRAPLPRTRERDSWDSRPAPRTGVTSFALCLEAFQRQLAWEAELTRDARKLRGRRCQPRTRQRERDGPVAVGPDAPPLATLPAAPKGNDGTVAAAPDTPASPLSIFKSPLSAVSPPQPHAVVANQGHSAGPAASAGVPAAAAAGGHSQPTSRVPSPPDVSQWPSSLV